MKTISKLLVHYTVPFLGVLILGAIGLYVTTSAAEQAQAIVDKQKVITDAHQSRSITRFSDIEDENHEQDILINTLARDMIAIKDSLVRIEQAVTRE